jgi:hypothetical protein
MQCSRCEATAVVKRSDGYFCGKCAVTRDWEEIIAVIQDATPDDAVVSDAFTEATYTSG